MSQRFGVPPSGITVGEGVTVDGGVYLGPEAPYFTLTSADFTSVGTGSGCEGDTTGFSIGGNYNSTGACYNPSLTPSKATEIATFFNNNDLGIGSASYLFDVTWANGSNTNTKRNVMVVICENSFLVMGTVDTNLTTWYLPGQNPLSSPNLKAANGTFLFPAVFRLIQPPIVDIVDWC
jgi:hypothetical protein